jgi:hypothetical protein
LWDQYFSALVLLPCWGGANKSIIAVATRDELDLSEYPVQLCSTRRSKVVIDHFQNLFQADEAK